eukprot:1599910-Rhodomonas_salina.3
MEKTWILGPTKGAAKETGQACFSWVWEQKEQKGMPRYLGKEEIEEVPELGDVVLKRGAGEDHFPLQPTARTLSIISPNTLLPNINSIPGKSVDLHVPWPGTPW